MAWHGRLTRVAMFGMTIREQIGRPDARPFLDRIVAGDVLQSTAGLPDLREYVEAIVRSGFPEPALRLTGEAQQRWLESYVDQLLTRDANEVATGRDPARLRRFFESYAVNTAGIVDEEPLRRRWHQSQDRDRLRTAAGQPACRRVRPGVDVEPPQAPRPVTEAVRRRSRSGSGGARLDVDGILRHGDLLGRMLDTFADGHRSARNSL